MPLFISVLALFWGDVGSGWVIFGVLLGGFLYFMLNINVSIYTSFGIILQTFLCFSTFGDVSFLFRFAMLDYM